MSFGKQTDHAAHRHGPEAGLGTVITVSSTSTAGTGIADLTAHIGKMVTIDVRTAPIHIRFGATAALTATCTTSDIIWAVGLHTRIIDDAHCVWRALRATSTSATVAAAVEGG